MKGLASSFPNEVLHRKNLPTAASFSTYMGSMPRLVAKHHFPVFTLVQSRLMMRWVAGSRALITNSFFWIASSG